ncbi:MAG: hypothetical protein F2652_08885 [Actinobacteria bacterium]|uniref:Unannotated protein n=2 Tax=freshwater metagenome TaxID=449393 RepID=A0A6J6NVM3_9ZZZZ|nr:hypothetical protein [Actinomycetota bacterium]
MNRKFATGVLVLSLFVGFTGVARAADVLPTREQQVVAIHAQYDPIFDAQYARILAIKAKTANNPKLLSSYNFILKDFLHVREFINTSLMDITTDIEVIKSYAEEETGEFSFSIPLLEKEAANSKTIICVKGKVSKKVAGLKPVCPSGYKKK